MYAAANVISGVMILDECYCFVAAEVSQVTLSHVRYSARAFNLAINHQTGRGKNPIRHDLLEPMRRAHCQEIHAFRPRMSRSFRPWRFVRLWSMRFAIVTIRKSEARSVWRSMMIALK